jgi:hypothetical protein
MAHASSGRPVPRVLVRFQDAQSLTWGWSAAGGCARAPPPPPPPISTTHRAERWFSPRTPRGILPSPRDGRGATAAFVWMPAFARTGHQSARLHERRRLALSNPVRDRAAEGLTGAPPNEHETSTRDRRRSDEQDCLLPGWPRSPGGHLHGVTCRSDDPGSRQLHDRRSETFPGAIRRAIRRALARAVLTARALLARSPR